MWAELEQGWGSGPCPLVWKRVSGYLLWAHTGPHMEGRWAGMAALGPTTPGPLLPSAGEVSLTVYTLALGYSCLSPQGTYLPEGNMA